MGNGNSRHKAVSSMLLDGVNKAAVLCPCLHLLTSPDPCEMRAIGFGTAGKDNAAPKSTLVTLLWAFYTLTWSIFTPPHKTFAARVALLQPLWVLRAYVRDSTWVQDLVLLLSLHSAYTYWIGIWHLPSLNVLNWVDIHNHVTQIYVQIFTLLAVCGGLSGGIVRRGHNMEERQQSKHLRTRSIDEQLLPPLLIPSRTAHSRLFPKRHSFSYSYLFVGVPVGMIGSVGKALSVDTEHRNWFHVSGADYLARGGASLDLAGKLRRYLQTHGVTDNDYSFAYFVTAPRLLGYSFNPVSFWYLYDTDAALKYMILEVNNTFDERRMYLLKIDRAIHENATMPEDDVMDGAPASKAQLVFSEIWEKDFHVSPFNSRKGSYSLRATDPLAAYEATGVVRIDNTIVLRSSKDSAKIVARVWSEGEPKEVAKIEDLQLYKFILSWWWVGLATFPRIVWEARKLFFKRKLHVWYRPEVTESSIGRTYTDDEQQLETFFYAFLKHAVEQSKEPLRVRYQPAHATGEDMVLSSPGSSNKRDDDEVLTLSVLSPAFYSRFVHYAHTKEAFDRECLSTDERNKTIAIENAELLTTLIVAMRDSEVESNQRRSIIAQVRWACLRHLRCPPAHASYVHDNAQDLEYTMTDIRSFGASELDRFVKKHCINGNVYRVIATKLFLAQRFAFGVPALVSAADWLIRAALILTALNLCDRWRHLDLMRPQEIESARIMVEDVQQFGVLFLFTNAVHLWSFLKD